jgi:hypothetical protein
MSSRCLGPGSVRTVSCRAESGWSVKELNQQLNQIAFQFFVRSRYVW